MRLRLEELHFHRVDLQRQQGWPVYTWLELVTSFTVFINSKQQQTRKKVKVRDIFMTKLWHFWSSNAFKKLSKCNCQKCLQFVRNGIKLFSKKVITLLSECYYWKCPQFVMEMLWHFLERKSYLCYQNVTTENVLSLFEKFYDTF